MNILLDTNLIKWLYRNEHKYKDYTFFITIYVYAEIKSYIRLQSGTSKEQKIKLNSFIDTLPIVYINEDICDSDENNLLKTVYSNIPLRKDNDVIDLHTAVVAHIADMVLWT